MRRVTILIILWLLLINDLVNGRKRRRIHSSKCQYTFIVNEMDPSLCPSPVVDFQADTISRTRHIKLDNTSTVNNHKMQDMLVWLHKIEKQLIGEMVRNEELNKTIAKHEDALRTANERFNDYHKNVTNLFKTMMYLEQKMLQQSDVSKNLDNKLSGIILDVVEVNNVLSNKVPTRGANLSGKEILVESASAIRSCGVTDEAAVFQGKALTFLLYCKISVNEHLQIWR